MTSSNLLTPDIEFEPSHALQQAAAFGSFALLPTNTQQVLMSLRRVFIHRTSDFLSKAEVQVLTVVSDGVSAEPIQLSSEVYEGIGRNTELPLGPGGIALYRTSDGKIPAFLDYRILVMELDEDVRKAGELLDAVRQDEQFKQFRTSLLAAAAVAAPPAALITAATDFTLNLLARLLKANRDDQLLLVSGSFSNTFDDLGTKYGPITQNNRKAEITYDVQAA